MATKPKMEVRTWEEDMAKAANVAGKSEAKLVERPFFSLGSGQVKLQGAILPGAQAPMIVLDHIHANLYYQGVYDPNTIVPPDCYAFGRADDEGNIIGVDTWDGRKEMAPHKDCTTRVHDQCEGCPMNEFKSARLGQGKACQNTRRLGVIAGGTMSGDKFTPFTKPEQIENATVAYAKVPATSGKTFGKFVKDTAEALSRPLWGVFTLLKVVPNTKAVPSHILAFENLGLVSNNLMPAVFEKQKAVAADLAFPFAPRSTAAPDPKAKGKKAPARRYT